MEGISAILVALSPIVGLFAGWVVGQLKAGNKRARAMEDGVKMLLRTKIIDKCLHYIEAGSIPPYALETIKLLFSSYLALGDGDPSVANLVATAERLRIRGG